MFWEEPHEILNVEVFNAVSERLQTRCLSKVLKNEQEFPRWKNDRKTFQDMVESESKAQRHGAALGVGLPTWHRKVTTRKKHRDMCFYP